MTRIHILGLGNLGRLYAHALVTAPKPLPISLLFHRESLSEEWEKAGRKIEIDNASTWLPGTPSSSSDYDIETINASPSKTDAPIQHLIIATKATATVKALRAVAHRLNYDSTILFTQNGLGTMEDVTKEYFQDLKTHPSYVAAVTSHGVYSKAPFHSVFAGLANVAIGHVSTPARGTQSKHAEYLIKRITSTPLLHAQAVSPSQLKILQLQKLVVNSTINPLTAIFRRKNGDLFTHKPILELTRVLLSELEEFFSGSRLSGLLDEQKNLFTADVLEELVLSVAKKTARNTSSMLQDVEAGRETEIDYINGWFIRQYREKSQRGGFGYLRCNDHLVEMVKAGRVIGEDDIRQEFGLSEKSGS